MLISKFDLYKSEWLELVFDARNKEYGAYDLRQHYAGNMVRAMGITFLGVGLLFGAAIITKPKPVVAVQTPADPTVIHVIKLQELKPLVTPPKVVQPPRPVAPPKMTAFTPPVVVADKLVTTPPPDVTKIVGAIGPVTTPGKNIAENVVVDIPEGNGPATAAPTVDNSVHIPIGLESMPEPIGGEKAWAKFLGKNLRFPAPAQEQGLSGRVIVGFIIEKDGSLSNITVDRPAGNGFDEEALRVLKMAKAWKPGIQNGQPVRVKFEIPINFQSASDN
jgi:protein TonB